MAPQIKFLLIWVQQEVIGPLSWIQKRGSDEKFNYVLREERIQLRGINCPKN